MLTLRARLFSAFLMLATITPAWAEDNASFAGKGQQASPLFQLDEGLAVFKIKHNGRRHFSVWLLDQQGNRLELLANTVGPFDGSKAVRIPANGTYLFDVAADGYWTIVHAAPPAAR